MRYAFLLSVALVPVFAQNNKSLVSERFTGRYHCGGAWRDFEFFASPVMGLLGVVDPDEGVTASINMSFHSFNGVETTGYRLKGTYDEKTGRFHFELEPQPEPWVSHHPAVYQALGIDGTFDAHTGKITARMLNDKCDKVEIVPRGEKLPPLPDQPPTLVAPRDPSGPKRFRVQPMSPITWILPLIVRISSTWFQPGMTLPAPCTTANRSTKWPT